MLVAADRQRTPHRQLQEDGLADGHDSRRKDEQGETVRQKLTSHACQVTPKTHNEQGAFRCS